MTKAARNLQFRNRNIYLTLKKGVEGGPGRNAAMESAVTQLHMIVNELVMKGTRLMPQREDGGFETQSYL